MQNTLTTLSEPVLPLDKGASELPAQLHEIEQLTTELKRLLVTHESILDEEGTRHEIEILERWMESYRRGLSAAHKISETGTTWLSDLRDRLKLSAAEKLRFEDEGGNPSSTEQLDQNEEILKAVNRIEKVLPNIEHLFPCAEMKEPQV